MSRFSKSSFARIERGLARWLTINIGALTWVGLAFGLAVLASLVGR